MSPSKKHELVDSQTGERMPTASPPDGEVHTDAVQTIVRAIERACGFFEHRVQAILREHELTEPGRTWYEVTKYAAAYEDLLESTGKHTVFRIGKELAHMADWEESAASVEDALATVETAYMSYHRGDVGRFEFEQTDDESGNLVCRTPYPAAVHTGFLRGLGQQFTDTGYVKPSVNQTSHEDGMYTTHIDVRWWTETVFEDTRLVTGDLTATTAAAGRDEISTD